VSREVAGASPLSGRRETTTNPTLGPARQVAVIGLVVAGALVGAGSGPIWLVPFIPFAGVGALLAIRRPRTSIGWILIGLGWSFAILMAPVQATAQQLADGTADLPSAALAVAQGGGGPAAFFLFALLAAVFPSGGLPTGRWGMLGRAALGFGLTIVVAGYLMPVISVNLAGSTAYAPVRNPIALLPDLALWRLVTRDDSIFPVMLVMLAAAVSVIVRVRRARGTERQQLRWFATSLAFVVLSVGTGFAGGLLVPGTSASGLAWIPAILAFTSVPVAVGIAVLRYRLYDIDRIISRTLAYAVMTAILAIVFAGIIVGLQALFATFTGGSTLAVAASTLVVAALFQPLRQRIQRAVDHRFNRARYDAEQTVAGFSVRLRDEMDISTVAADLHGTVLGAVNPSSLGLWIREARP
jgi:MFS family permease